MKKEIEKTKEKVNEEKLLLVKSQERDSIKIPTGFTRNYSATTNPLNNISNQLVEQFKLMTQELKISLKSTISEKIKKSMDDFKNEMEITVRKLIETNNNNMCHLVMDIIRLIVPSADKPTEKTINIISSRFNHHQLGTISTKKLTENVNKKWR